MSTCLQLPLTGSPTSPHFLASACANPCAAAPVGAPDRIREPSREGRPRRRPLFDLFASSTSESLSSDAPAFHQLFRAGQRQLEITQKVSAGGKVTVVDRRVSPMGTQRHPSTAPLDWSESTGTPPSLSEQVRKAFLAKAKATDGDEADDDGGQLEADCHSKFTLVTNAATRLMALSPIPPGSIAHPSHPCKRTEGFDLPPPIVPPPSPVLSETTFTHAPPPDSITSGSAAPPPSPILGASSHYTYHSSELSDLHLEKLRLPPSAWTAWRDDSSSTSPRHSFIGSKRGSANVSENSSTLTSRAPSTSTLSKLGSKAIIPTYTSASAIQLAQQLQGAPPPNPSLSFGRRSRSPYKPVDTRPGSPRFFSPPPDPSIRVASPAGVRPLLTPRNSYKGRVDSSEESSTSSDTDTENDEPGFYGGPSVFAPRSSSMHSWSSQSTTLCGSPSSVKAAIQQRKLAADSPPIAALIESPMSAPVEGAGMFLSQSQPRRMSNSEKKRAWKAGRVKSVKPSSSSSSTKKVTPMDRVSQSLQRQSSGKM